MRRVLVVRHGETAWNRAGRVQGWADSELTDRGRRQARETGAHLADRDVDRLVVSDLRRTRETAAGLTAAGVEVDPSHSRAWRERSFGQYQGFLREEIAERRPTFAPEESLLTLRDVPDGESLATVRDRVVDGWQALEDDLGQNETAVVVTHGGPIRVLVAHLTGRDLRPFADEFSPGNCGLTEIDLDGDATVERLDDDAHLDGV
jgi:probable phosphoglycerate mutase